jgi:ABC-type antimicrobial peptide transport system permease subunit
LQGSSSNPSRINEVLIQVKNSNDVNTVAARLKKDFPGGQVITSKQLAESVSGSLSDAHSLATHLGGALAVIILLAAFLIAALLTLSSIAKRVREIGTLRALGWSRGRVVRQIMAETVGIGVIGAVLGVAVGVAVCAAIGAFAPVLTSTSTGTAVGASTVGSLFHQAAAATGNTKVHLHAPITAMTILLGVVFAVVGGLVAGIAGGWRAARLPPASALRDIG